MEPRNLKERIYLQAGKNIYYPGEEGIQRYKFEITCAITEMQNLDFNRLYEVVIFKPLNENNKQEYEAAKQRQIEKLTTDLKQADTEEFKNKFKENQIAQLSQYIEIECLIPTLYLLKLGYVTVSSNSEGPYYRGISFYDKEWVKTPFEESPLNNVRYFLSLPDDRLNDPFLNEVLKELLLSILKFKLEANQIYEGVPPPEGSGQEVVKDYANPIKLSAEILKQRKMDFDFDNLPSLEKMPSHFTKEQIIQEIVKKLDTPPPTPQATYKFK